MNGTAGRYLANAKGIHGSANFYHAARNSMHGTPRLNSCRRASESRKCEAHAWQLGVHAWQDEVHSRPTSRAVFGIRLAALIG
jgi:hypothetical protein